MKIVEVQCGHCGQTVEKPAKEVTRQRKHGRTVFFCNRTCSAKANPSLMVNAGRPSEAWTKAGSAVRWKDNEFTGFREHIRRAKQRCHEFDLTPEDLQAVWKQQNGRCVYTGIELQHPHYKNKIDPIHVASLDRIDSSLGYVVGNVQFVCLPMNYAKSTMSDEMVRKWLDLVRTTRLD